MLGMAVETYSPDGAKTKQGEAGELVCVRPFPCMPLGFWPLPGVDAPDEAVKAALGRFHQAYFAEYEHVWRESWPAVVRLANFDCTFRQVMGTMCCLRHHVAEMEGASSCWEGVTVFCASMIAICSNGNVRDDRPAEIQEESVSGHRRYTMCWKHASPPYPGIGRPIRLRMHWQLGRRLAGAWMSA